ncbi:hypothetical protein GCM10011390_20810 [Aureimonas endophytica]|uniref:Uncharacterized protein n=1 Tax=Aureimonas endophytica TaxID=2027858 RepID=A0A917E451_9HYPH|nr:hypothetical protein [Aureimonas endophytica]GGE01804.1 hypothetical protein GCM10011390_20810 [Aureimonas endophytica]
MPADLLQHIEHGFKAPVVPDDAEIGRLKEPNESFYTSSNHRLRDSHVGRSGHWVDIEVFGKANDEELATIERLAQLADTRPVRVRMSTHWGGPSGRRTFEGTISMRAAARPAPYP